MDPETGLRKVKKLLKILGKSHGCDDHIGRRADALIQEHFVNGYYPFELSLLIEQLAKARAFNAMVAKDERELARIRAAIDTSIAQREQHKAPVARNVGKAKMRVAPTGDSSSQGGVGVGCGDAAAAAAAAATSSTTTAATTASAIIPTIAPARAASIVAATPVAAGPAMLRRTTAVSAPGYEKKATTSPPPPLSRARQRLKNWRSLGKACSANVQSIVIKCLLVQFPWLSEASLHAVAKAFNFNYTPAFSALCRAFGMPADSRFYVADQGKGMVLLDLAPEIDVGSGDGGGNGDRDEDIRSVRVFLHSARTPDRLDDHILRVLDRIPATKVRRQLISEVSDAKALVRAQIEEGDAQIVAKIDTEEKEAAKSTKSSECQCCYDNVTFEGMVQCVEGHLFCASCMKRYVSEGVFGGGGTDVYCMAPDCGKPFDKRTMRLALGRELWKKLEERKMADSIAAAGLEGLTRCPAPDCGFAMIMAPEEQIFRCQHANCKRVSCRKCGTPWENHRGLSCELANNDSARKRAEEAMTQSLLRSCPKCGISFLKETGCNLMTCPSCSQKMCYICKMAVPGYAHFNGSSNRNKRKYSDKCPLYSSDSAMKRLDSANVEATRKQIEAEAAKTAAEQKGEDQPQPQPQPQSQPQQQQPQLQQQPKPHQQPRQQQRRKEKRKRRTPPPGGGVGGAAVAHDQAAVHALPRRYPTFPTPDLLARVGRHGPEQFPALFEQHPSLLFRPRQQADDILARVNALRKHRERIARKRRHPKPEAGAAGAAIVGGVDVGGVDVGGAATPAAPVEVFDFGSIIPPPEARHHSMTVGQVPRMPVPPAVPEGAVPGVKVEEAFTSSSEGLQEVILLEDDDFVAVADNDKVVVLE